MVSGTPQTTRAPVSSNGVSLNNRGTHLWQIEASTLDFPGNRTGIKAEIGKLLGTQTGKLTPLAAHLHDQFNISDCLE